MKVAAYREHIRKLNANELKTELNKVELELFNVRLNIRAGQMKNYAHITKLRHDIARIKTILHSNS